MELCDKNCNECPIILHPNNRVLTKLLNQGRDSFGQAFADMVQDACPNLTVCFDCRIDDFCHRAECELGRRQTT